MQPSQFQPKNGTRKTVRTDQTRCVSLAVDFTFDFFQTRQNSIYFNKIYAHDAACHRCCCCCCHK